MMISSGTMLYMLSAWLSSRYHMQVSAVFNILVQTSQMSSQIVRQDLVHADLHYNNGNLLPDCCHNTQYWALLRA